MHRLVSYCNPRFAAIADVMGYDSTHLQGILPPPGDPWSISPELGILLFRLTTEYRLSRILEFGAGSSSVVLAAALSRIGGGILTSIEETPIWCARQWERVKLEKNVDADLIGARPELDFGLSGPVYTYRAAGPVVASRGPYDLVLVDAPQYYFGRDGALPLCYPHLAVGALIVLDDARRSAERWSVRRWLRTYRGLELVLYDPDLARKGVAVLQVTAPLKPRADAITLLTSAYHAVELWTKRRKRRRHGKERGARLQPGL